MSERGPWSVKGIDQRARSAARDAARSEGVTLGEYLNRLILEEPDDPLHNEINGEGGAAPDAKTTLDQLARRVEAAEARSTLAITGIDQSVLGLVARLERTESGQDMIVNHVDGFIDELRETHDALSQKVKQLEADETAEQSLDALKALEQALGKLATHVYEEGERQQAEDEAVRGRVEAGFADINERVETVETRVESTLSEAARRVEKAVEQAELRTEGANRHLAERFNGLETQYKSDSQAINERLTGVEGDVTGALGSMEQTLLRVQERLNRAEGTTDAALKSLETTFASLDRRITEVAAVSDPAGAEALRAELESRFEGLADELRGEVQAARAVMAQEISDSMSTAPIEEISSIKEEVAALSGQVSESDAKAARAFETLGDQVSRITSSFDRRLQDVETGEPFVADAAIRSQIDALHQQVDDRLEEIDTREAAVVERVGQEVGKLADRLETRVAESEAASARAIEQVGEQVANVTQRLQIRHDDSIAQLSDQIEKDRNDQDAKLSFALDTMSERFEEIKAVASDQVSPVQRAIAALASRLDALDGQLRPTDGEDPEDDALAAFQEVISEDNADANANMYAEGETDGYASADFEPGLPEWGGSSEDGMASTDGEPPATNTSYEEDDDFFETPIAAQTDESNAIDHAEDDDDFFESVVEAKPEAEDKLAETAAASAAARAALFDPLEALGSWDEDNGGQEVRDDEIFEDLSSQDDPNVPLPPGHLDLEPEMPTAAKAFDEFGSDEASDTDMDVDDESEIDPVTGLEEVFDTEDYIARARQAALAANADSQSGQGARGKGASARMPMYAAASVVVLAAAGTVAFTQLRGKQTGETIVEPAIVESAEAPIPSETPAPLDVAELDVPPVMESESEVVRDDASFDVAETDIAETDIAETDTAEDVLPLADVTADDTVASDVVVGTLAAMTPVSASPPRPEVQFASIPPAISLSDAVAGGDPIAALEAGLQAMESSDYGAASDLIGRAAQTGMPAAQYHFSKLHEKGLGLPRDLAAARDWTSRAAEGGNVRAMHDLAVFFADGEGGAKSYTSAAEWFSRASEFGVLDSQYNLAILYEQGLGLTTDPVEALFWFSVAAEGGDRGSEAQVNRLMRQVSQTDSNAVRARVDAWRAAVPNARANGEFGAQPWQGGGRARIRAVQEALNALGYNAGRPDGVFGPGTAQAVQAYQESNDLPVTGTLTDAVVDSLNARAS